MIKATGKKDGRPFIVLGLSYRNLKRLQADEPICFDATHIGFDGEIMIFAGPTEESMAKQIMRLYPEAEKHTDPNARDHG